MNFTTRLLALALFSAPAFAGTVRLTTADRVTLSADYSGAGTHGVVLVHGFNEDRSTLAELSKSLAQGKLQILAVDLRGHGASAGKSDPLKSVNDINAAVAYLHKQGAKEVSVIGAGMGGNLAFLAAAKDPTIHNAVMISPALNHNGVKASAALEGYGDRPILMLVGQNDALATKAANMLGDRLKDATIEMLTVSGSGSTLVKRDPELPNMVLDWLVGTYEAAKDGNKPDLTTENQDLETTGVKLGDR